MVDIEYIPASITICPKCGSEDCITGKNYKNGDKVEVRCGQCGHIYTDEWYYDHDYENENIY